MTFLADYYPHYSSAVRFVYLVILTDLGLQLLPPLRIMIKVRRTMRKHMDSLQPDMVSLIKMLIQLKRQTTDKNTKTK